MGKKTLFLIVAALIIIGGIAYFFSRNSSNNTISRLNAVHSSSTVSVPGWATCDYPGFGFRIQYPPDWQVSVVSKAQGGGTMGPIITTCGNIDAGSVLGQIVFQPSIANASSSEVGMTLLIRDSAAEVQDYSAAQKLLIESGTATYDGKIYTVTFGKDTSSTIKYEILHSFEFIPQ